MSPIGILIISRHSDDDDDDDVNDNDDDLDGDPCSII
jgi:hypothetical protein